MRTTLTIDDDVAALIKQEMRGSGESFKGAVNRLLRQGLMSRNRKQAKKRFVVKPLPMGLKPGLSYDSIPELLEKIEGPYHR